MTVSTLGLIVRVALYIVTGALARDAWIDDETAQMIRHPETVAAVTGGIAAAWWALAKWRGWAT